MATKLAGIPYRIAHSHIANDIKPASNSHNIDISFFRKKYVLIRQAFIKKLVSFASTNYFGCSRMACEWMFTKKINKEGKAIVVKNPINVSKFKFNISDRLEIRNKLKIDNKKVFGHIGRFVYSKNHIFLLEVFAEIRKKDKNAVLVLVGSGKLEKNINEKIKELNLENDVILYGETTEVQKLYSAFDVFLFPSVYEGLGIVLVEAQANGLPILAANTIPSEVKLTDNMKFLPIDNVEVWCKEIENNNLLIRNNENYDIVLKSGYDIKDVSKFLQDTYLSVNKKEI